VLWLHQAASQTRHLILVPLNSLPMIDEKRRWKYGKSKVEMLQRCRFEEAL
jgi:hypothetical protein